MQTRAYAHAPHGQLQNLQQNQQQQCASPSTAAVSAAGGQVGRSEQPSARIKELSEMLVQRQTELARLREKHTYLSVQLEQERKLVSISERGLGWED